MSDLEIRSEGFRRDYTAAADALGAARREISELIAENDRLVSELRWVWRFAGDQRENHTGFKHIFNYIESSTRSRYAATEAVEPAGGPGVTGVRSSTRLELLNELTRTAQDIPGGYR
jgi:hypothetical protein